MASRRVDKRDFVKDIVEMVGLFELMMVKNKITEHWILYFNPLLSKHYTCCGFFLGEKEEDDQMTKRSRKAVVSIDYSVV